MASGGGAVQRDLAMKYDLFISHSSEDAGTAQALVTDFENRNITCWMAPRDIPMGSSYHEEIVQAIENSRAVLLLFSSAANKSAHVLREVELAEQGRKPILPLRIDVSDPAGGLKYMLANKQWVERKALGNRLVDTIEQLLTGARPIHTGVDEARARPVPEPPKKSGLSPMLIGAIAVVVLLLAGGIGAWQGDWFGFAAREQARKEELVRKAEQARKEKEEQARQEKEDQARKEEQARKDEDARREEVARKEDEARREEQARREARLKEQRENQQAVKKAETPDLLKTAPTVGEAVPGKTFFRECDLCPVMAVIPSGTNIMGSPPGEPGRSANEGRQQLITIRPPLAVGRSEVSFEEYLACIAEGGCKPGRPSDYEWGYGKQPAINVSWDDAQKYVDWLSQKTKGRYRLLSEAEWEYAARGCAKVCESTPFWFGDDIDKSHANYDWRYVYLGGAKNVPLLRTVPIDQGQANPFGLLNVHGNVREWVQDCWNEALDGIAKDGAPRLTGDCSRRVVRGGSWDDPPKDLRSAKRSWELPSEPRAQIGFRVARELKL